MIPDNIIVIRQKTMQFFDRAVLGSDGFIYAGTSDNRILDGVASDIIYREMEEMNEDRPHPWIMDIRNITDITYEGASFLFSGKFTGVSPITALITGRVSRISSRILMSYVEGIEIGAGKDIDLKCFYYEEDVVETSRNWILGRKDHILKVKLQRLDDMQLKILAGILKLKTHQKIANALNISKSTVDRKRTELLKHLGSEDLYRISCHIQNIGYVREIITGTFDD